MQYIYPQESKKLIGLAMQLHRELGCGFKEKVYQDAFEVLLKESGITYEREKQLTITYHGVKLKHDFFYDFFCYNKIGIEIKATKEITPEFESQIINYLHVGNQQLGFIFNFGAKSLEFNAYPNKNYHTITQQTPCTPEKK